MESLTVRLLVGEDRRIVVELPTDAPTGFFEVTILPLIDSEALSRAAARRHVQTKLRAAGILNTNHAAPADAHLLTADERIRLGTLFHEPHGED